MLDNTEQTQKAPITPEAVPPVTEQANKPEGNEGAPKTEEQKTAERSARMTALNMRKQREKEAQRKQDAADATRFRELTKMQKENPAEFFKQVNIDKRKIALDYLEETGTQLEKPPAPTLEQTVTEMKAAWDAERKATADKEEARQKEEAQNRFAQQRATEIKLAQELVSDTKHGDRFEAVKAYEQWDVVYQTAIQLAAIEGFKPGTLSPEEAQEMLLRAADGVEKELVTQETKRPKLKKLTASQQAAIDEAAAKAQPAAKPTSLGRRNMSRTAPSVATKPAPKKRLSDAEEWEAFVAKHPELKSNFRRA